MWPRFKLLWLVHICKINIENFHFQPGDDYIADLTVPAWEWDSIKD